MHNSSRASSICAPIGIFSVGRHQVTGSEEPANIGNLSRSEMATMLSPRNLKERLS